MVYLVGAGIGDSKLITVKGLECIKNADVIIYDHLANPTLLSYAKEDCLLLYAGKIAGNHHLSQDKINDAIVKYSKCGNVVRLKGGDPFIFGRGGEEVKALCDNNIPYEIVPGISSCYGVPEYCGIPVTHRGISSSFHVITGHEKKDGNTVNYKALANLNATLVFLMGLSHSHTISYNLIENGMDEDTPVCIISGGSTEKQKFISGTLKKLSKLAKEMFSPAVIVVGNVTKIQNSWFSPSGKKIIATGTQAINSQLRKAFGHDITEIPLIKLTKLNFTEFSEINFANFTHVVFTSENGVNIFFEYLKQNRTDIRIFRDTKFAAVGKKTAMSLENHGIYADIVPEIQNGKELGKILAKKCSRHDNLLIVRAENGNNDLTNELNDLTFTDIHLYKTETDYSKKELLNLCLEDADYVILSSGSAAKAFSQLTQKNAKLISIGPSTTAAAEKYGLKIYATASKHDAEGIVECINREEN